VRRRVLRRESPRQSRDTTIQSDEGSRGLQAMTSFGPAACTPQLPSNVDECCSQVLGNPIDNVVWIANELSKQSIGLKPGQLIPIGTWTDLHLVQRGSLVRATFGPLESVEIEFR
jgi:hypothetical protein